MAHFKLFNPCVCSPFCKWGASRAGENRTLQNSEEMKLQKINKKHALDREEQRLNLIEELRTFEGKFGHWSTREYAVHSDRMLAALSAIVFLGAVLRDDEAEMKARLSHIAFNIGYRLKEGRFEE